jgi:hypothetical protein
MILTGREYSVWTDIDVVFDIFVEIKKTAN